MKNLTLSTFITLFLVMLAVTYFTMPVRIHQEISHTNNYVMQEPFSSSPLIIYPSLEAGLGT